MNKNIFRILFVATGILIGVLTVGAIPTPALAASPPVAYYGLTGDPYVDSVLSGVKWGTGSLTFSFPIATSTYGFSYGSGEPANNFKAFTAIQQDATRIILQGYSAVANLTFTEDTETDTKHAALRYGMSDAPSTAWAYYPSFSELGGDAWFNNSKGKYNSPARGNYAWMTILHETGHAMGLKHPHSTSAPFPAMPLDKDSVEYTVMSYRSYTGSGTGGYTVSNYPQTLMMYDIAALQVLYGANYNTNNGATVYTWSATTGQMSINGVAQWVPSGNKIFMTLWDGGGNDTYDLSNYSTNLIITLAPGGWTTTSATQLAALGSGRVPPGNIANAFLYQNNTASLIENAIGGSGSDSIIGNNADNILTGGPGNDSLNGGLGNNTAKYSGGVASYLVTQNSDGSWTVTDQRSGSPDGTDTLQNIQMLLFSDGPVAVSATPPVCTRSAPLVSANPTQYSDAVAGGAKNYTFTINNTDSIICGPSTFAITSVVPSGWLETTSVPSVTINPGSFGTTTTTITSAASATAGTTSISVRIINGAVSIHTVVVPVLYGIPLVCTRQPPLVTLSPSNSTVTAGSHVSYDVKVTNRDTMACPSSTFSLSSVVPSGWSENIVSNPLTIAPGLFSNAAFTVSSLSSTPDGSYPLIVNVTDTNTFGHDASGSSIYTVMTGTGGDTPVLDTAYMSLHASRVRSGNSSVLVWSVSEGLAPGISCAISPSNKIKSEYVTSIEGSNEVTSWGSPSHPITAQTVPLTSQTVFTLTCSDGVNAPAVKSAVVQMIPIVNEI